jgi:deoxycytidine triphosphate deaminase
MAILSKSQIASLVTKDIEDFKARLERCEAADRILISPFQDSSLGPTSYDLHIGEQYISLIGEPHVKQIGERSLRIEPRESFTIVSQEYVGLPYNIAGMIFAKVSWLERGLSQISSYIHPGFHGHLAETLTNTTDHPLEIAPGSAFCQIVFCEVPQGTFDERYISGRIGQTVDKIMERLMAPHSNPRRGVPLKVIPPERKTVGGFVRYLLGERFIEGGEADIQRLSESPRWKIVSRQGGEGRRELR